jgi:hypothetical protein
MTQEASRRLGTNRVRTEDLVGVSEELGWRYQPSVADPDRPASGGGIWAANTSGPCDGTDRNGAIAMQSHWWSRLSMQAGATRDPIIDCLQLLLHRSPFKRMGTGR